MAGRRFSKPVSAAVRAAGVSSRDLCSGIKDVTITDGWAFEWGTFTAGYVEAVAARKSPFAENYFES